MSKSSKNRPGVDDAATDDPEADALARADADAAAEDKPPPPPPVNVWVPSTPVSVEFTWTHVADAYAVKLLLYQTREAPGPDGVVPVTYAQVIVDTVLDDARPEVPFSMRTVSNPYDILSGRLMFQREGGVTQLWVRGLRYPGGSVAQHRLD